MCRILLVEDEAPMLQALQHDVASLPCEVEAFSQPRLALARAQTTPFDLVVTDYQMPGMDGVMLISALKQANPKLVAILLCGFADLRSAMGANNEAQVYRHLTKPWDANQLRIIIRQAMAQGGKGGVGSSPRSQAAMPPAPLGKGALAALERKFPGVTLPGSGWRVPID